MEKDSFYIETYGCASNKADSYIISTLLKKANYQQTSLEKAHFVIINTCAVKEPTENKIKTRLKELHELYKDDSNKRVIVAGCFPQITDKHLDLVKKIIPSFAAVVDLDAIDRFPEILKEVKGSKMGLIFSSVSILDKAQFPIEHREGKITGIVPISEGCLGACAYCCVKHARGRLVCYDPKNIVNNARHQLDQGIRQVYLTSQDCSVYEHNQTELYDLIKSINSLDYDFFLRVGMINPSFFYRGLDQLEAIYSLEKVYHFLHVPVQSGSDKVLKSMNRPYLLSELIDKFKKLKNTHPDLTISTDVICGFPGETEEDFQQTVDFIEWLKPEILNISKFGARPGTVAKKMEQLSSNLIKERSIRMTKVFRKTTQGINNKWKGWIGKALLLHPTSNENQAFGRNFAYKNVIIDDYKGEYGAFVRVKIKRVEDFNLYGAVI